MNTKLVTVETKKTNELINSMTICMICSASVGVSTRHRCLLFEQQLTSSDKLLANVVSEILGLPLVNGEVHSKVICKKCFKLCDEFEEHNNRIMKLKSEITSNYERTRKEFIQTHGMDLISEEEPNKKKLCRLSNKAILPEDTEIDKVDIVIQEEEVDDLEQPDEFIRDEIIEIDADFFIDGDDDIKNDPTVTVKNLAEDSDSQITGSEDLEDETKSSNKGDKNVVLHENGLFTCLLCEENKFCSDSYEITAHIRNIHDTKIYICDICGKLLFKRGELSKHIEDHDKQGAGSFECEVCRRIFTNFRLFRVHRKMHNPSSKNYCCETCGKRFGSRSLLDEHNNVHTGDRPHVCTICSKTFTSKYTLRSHVKIHEKRSRSFVCINCGKGFLTAQNLIHHERIHSGIKNYICQECGESFVNAHTLELHCIKHTGFKPFICRLCGKAFSRPEELENHERMHTGEKPFQCEICGQSFSQRSNLMTHKRTTHYEDKRYKCQDCGKAFKRRRLLDYHMKAAHTGERPYKCTICLATFIYPEHFKKHKMIHTGEKPYECEVCGKAFNSRDNRNAHRFVHSDKKPYECVICGTGFMRKPLLYKHMKAVGHDSENTIVVNQPLVKNLRSKVSLQSNNGISTLSQGLGDSPKMYIQSVKERIIIPEEEIQQHNMHIVVNNPLEGLEVQYASQDGREHLGIVEEADVVLPSDNTSRITYTEENVPVDETPVRIVQINLNDDDVDVDDDDDKQWHYSIQT